MMRVTNQPVSGITKAYNQPNKGKTVEKGNEAAKYDAVNFSSEARFYSTALKALQQLPETPEGQEQKLEELKVAIKVGSYAVKNEELVEKIWDLTEFKG
jgi:negative regulator of flagellin synthesis FlgM